MDTKRDFAEIYGAGRPSTTIGELFDAYKAGPLSKLKRAEVTSRALNAALMPWADRDPLLLTTEELRKFVTTMSITAPVNANRTLAYLKAFFAWAVEQGAIDVNPARSIHPIIKEAPRERTLTLHELGEIWNAVETLDEPFRSAIQILILTAALREEVATIGYSDVALDPEVRALVWTIRPPGDDPRQHHVLPLSRAAVTILGQWALQQDAEGALLFSTTGTTPISGWSKVKRRLDGRINARRTERGRTAMPAWRLNDLRYAFEHHARERLHVDPFEIECCLGRVTELGSARAQFRASLTGIAIAKRDLFEAWAELVLNAAREEPNLIY